MVLHHVDSNKLESVLQNIYKSLNKNGFLLIKEHDSCDINDSILINIEHALYTLKSEEKMKITLNQNNHYLSRFEWDFILKKNGFKLIGYTYNLSNIKHNIRPNRGFISLYQKI